MTSIEKKPLCIIPARGGTRRFPGKNIALLAGKPLLAYAIETALRSGVFSVVCVSSDDQKILETATSYGAQMVLKRPNDLSGDKTQVKDVCIQILETLESQGRLYREFAVLLVTNPLRTADDIKTAYETFTQHDTNYLMSVVPYSHPPQRAVWAPSGYLEPFFSISNMKPTQELETLYRHDGSFIFGKTEVFLKEKEFYGTNVIPYYIPIERSVDIDHPIDLAWAEFLLRSQSKNPAYTEISP